MKNIKNIIFDFGDVFINLDKPATQKHLDEFGIHQLNAEILEVNNLYEKGDISTEAFIEAYLQTYPQLTKSTLVNAWNSILKDLPAYRLEFMKHLKNQNKYRFFLLSNTNELHIDWVAANVASYEEFKSYFEVFYLSYEMGYRKPEPEIFQHVLDQNNLVAEETLFIDDTKEHVLSAKSVGLHTWHLDPATEDVIDLFQKIK